MLVLKELALNAPTFFFQQIQPFFENISNAVRDPKVSDSRGVPLNFVLPGALSQMTVLKSFAQIFQICRLQSSFFCIPSHPPFFSLIVLPLFGVFLPTIVGRLLFQVFF